MDIKKDAFKLMIIEHEVTDTVDSANNQSAFLTDLALINHFANVENMMQRVVNELVLCLDCENPITAERLSALPACCRCIDCQIAHEKELNLCR